MKKKIFLSFVLFAVLTITVFTISFTTISYANTEVVKLCAEETTKVDAVKQWFDRFFSPEKVAMYCSWLAYIGTIIGLAASLKKLKASNNLTLKNVSAEVKDVLTNEITTAVTSSNEKYLPLVVNGQEKTNHIMSIFAKMIALSQENTPESRVAILNLVSELGVVEQEMVDTAKDIVEQEQKDIEEHKKSIEKQVDEIIEKYDGTSI